MKARVHVAGSGVISAIGDSVRDNLKALEASASGIGALTLFDSVHQNLPVGEVKMSNEALADDLHVSAKFPRTTLLGIKAAREAVASSGINLRKWRTGLISATTVGGMDLTEKFYDDFVASPSSGHLFEVVNHSCGKTAEIIAADLGVTHFTTTINTACSSSANAIALGARMITAGLLDVVVAGGTDALTKFTLNGFNSLMILDSRPCRPLDADRRGLNLGEGAGFVLLISDDVKKSEGLTFERTVTGFANTNDAFHQTASSPEGRGSFAAMQQTLKMAGLAIEDVDYINLHGTGTANNDLSETTAVRRLFGEKLPPVSSTKAFTGHTLGASGGIEAVFSILAIDHQCVFPNLRFEKAIPETNIIPQQTFQHLKEIRHVMSNSFGFGGNCSSLLFSKYA